ncbi:MAG: hypothetical protein QM781_13850 [Chitinophagaceae bacterium]
MQPQDPPLSEEKLRLITEPPSLPRNDRKARKELDAYFNEQLRKERLKNVINWLFIFFIITAAVVATLGIAIRLLHLILPESNKWLTDAQIQGIDKLFFSGAIGGLLTSYFKKSNEN